MATKAIVTAVCWAALLLPGVAGAQEAGAREPEAALESIDSALEEIVQLLRVHVGNQRAELAVRRLDIASRELGSRARELSDVETKRDLYARQQRELLERMETFGDAPPENSGMTEADYEYMLKQMELQAESAKQNLWRADQRIIDLRAEITRIREDLLVWEEIVAASFVDE